MENAGQPPSFCEACTNRLRFVQQTPNRLSLAVKTATASISVHSSFLVCSAPIATDPVVNLHMPKRMLLLAVLCLLCYYGWQKVGLPSDVNAETLLVVPQAATRVHLSAPTTKSVPTEVATAKPDRNTVNNAVKAAALLQQAITQRQCWNVPVDEAALEAWLQQATQWQEVPEQIFGMRQRFAQCQQHFVTTSRQSVDAMANTTAEPLPAQAENYLTLLLQAAALGSDAAVQQLWSLSEAELVRQLQLTDLPREEKIRLKQEFKQRQYQLAIEVAQAGGEQATLLLINGYQQYDPVTGGQSYDKALAYIDFMLETSRNNEIYAKLQSHRDRLLTRMTEDEITRAQHLSEQLLQTNHGE